MLQRRLLSANNMKLATMCGASNTGRHTYWAADVSFLAIMKCSAGLLGVDGFQKSKKRGDCSAGARGGEA
jgi:hypothetical protein